MALPAEFWVANQFGVRGGVENAFMSTTLERSVARKPPAYRHYFSILSI